MSRSTEIIILAELDEFKLLVFNGSICQGLEFHKPRVERGGGAEGLLKELIDSRHLGAFHKQLLCNIVMAHYAKTFDELTVRVTLFD